MNQKIIIPISIIVAGLLVAGAIFYSNKQPASQQPAGGPIEIAIEPVNENDWIRGSVDARIKLVEYSDTECPFCQRFHSTMNDLITQYDGEDVAWIYRHLPLASLHSKAMIEAIALECAGELGGQTGFWNYTNQLYEETPSNNGLDLNRLPEIAVEQGLDRNAFEACLDEDKHQEAVEADLADATNSATHLGGVGTPYTVLVSEEELNDEALQAVQTISQKYAQSGQIIYVSDDNKRMSISGALPIGDMKLILDAALGN